jgi:hypothetical protein
MGSMEIKDVEVTCPCCSTRITLDVRTRKILRSRPPKRVDESGKPVLDAKDWDEINSKVKNRLGSASDKFEEGLARETTREKDLDDLFRKANDKIRRGDDDS